MITQLKKRSFFQEFLIELFAKSSSPKALSVKHKAKGEPKVSNAKRYEVDGIKLKEFRSSVDINNNGRDKIRMRV